jgi:hypothetical protein
MVARAGALE